MSHSQDNTASQLAAELDMLRIHDDTLRLRDNGGSHVGEAEASGDRQPGGGRPEDTSPPEE